MKKLLSIIFCLAVNAFGQSTTIVTTPGASATILAGTGSPTSNSSVPNFTAKVFLY